MSVINRDLRDVIIVDNLPQSYINHPKNGLPIDDFLGSTNDNELEKIWTVLERLNQVDDVREYIPQFVVRDKISMYRLLKLIAPPRGVSPLNGIIDSFKDFKRGAAAFFGISDGKSTAEDSNDTSSEDSQDEDTDENDDTNEDEDIDQDSEINRKVRLNLPTSSKSFSKPNFEDSLIVGSFSQTFSFESFHLILIDLFY